MMVFQEYEQLLPWKTALQNVEFAARRTKPGSEARRAARRTLSLVGLDAATERYPHELSGGMQQRVAIARAIVTAPRLVLMDEPFGALDALTRSRLQEEIARIARESEITTVFVTHSIAEAVFLGNRIVVMGKDGRITRVFDNDFHGVRHRDSPETVALQKEIREILAGERPA